MSKDHEVLVLTTKGPRQRKLTEDYANVRVVELKQSNVAPIYAIQKNQPHIGLSTIFIWTLFDLWNISYFIQIKKIIELIRNKKCNTNTGTKYPNYSKRIV